MSWLGRKRNPFGPIRVPAGKAGDSIIDFLCKFYGTTREEALARGQESMRTMIRNSPVIPRPMKAPVGAMLFGFNKEEAKQAKVKVEQNYTSNCLRMAQNILGCDTPEYVKEVSIRHYYSTRYVLELASAWVERAAQIAPELQDRHLEDVRWAIKTVLEGADKDLRECERWMETER